MRWEMEHYSVTSEIIKEFQVCYEETKRIIYLRALRQTTRFIAFISMLFSINFFQQLCNFNNLPKCVFMKYCQHLVKRIINLLVIANEQCGDVVFTKC